MSRYRKGTMDHDGDGRMGGSMKGNHMTKDTKAFENFNKAHATGDKPAAPIVTDDKEKAAPKAEKAVEAATSRAPDQADSQDVKEDKPKRKSVVDGDHELHWAYQQGRAARQSAISKEEAPHDGESEEYKAWLKGWKFEDNA